MGKEIQNYHQRPESFSPRAEVAACILEAKGRFLLMKKAPESEEAGLWSLPGGKMNPGESLQDAVRREIFEETKIVVQDPQFCRSLYIRKGSFSYIYHEFYEAFVKIPQVLLSSEHTEFVWTTIEQAIQMPLMAGGKEILQMGRL